MLSTSTSSTSTSRIMSSRAQQQQRWLLSSISCYKSFPLLTTALQPDLHSPGTHIANITHSTSCSAAAAAAVATAAAATATANMVAEQQHMLRSHHVSALDQLAA
jgi:hypothetical protein